MAFYRLYHFNGDGHIVRCDGFDAPSDREALHEAERLREDAPMELWMEMRKVRRWDALSLNHLPSPADKVRGPSPDLGGVAEL